MKLDFEAFPKIGRLKRPITVTEKIDGTNAQIVVARADILEGDVPPYAISVVADGIPHYVVFASRSKYIKVGDDNYGFAAQWTPHAAELAVALGEGRHFGEWWGKGIQRGYGMTGKKFSLFNTMRWSAPEQLERLAPLGIGVVPVLYQGPMTETGPYVDSLAAFGSSASPGYMDPEGIVVYHHATRTMFKQTIDKDEEPKGKQA